MNTTPKTKTKEIERLLTTEIQALRNGDTILAALARSERLTILDTVEVS